MKQDCSPSSGMKEAGFTLAELLIGIAIMGLILGGLYQVLGQTLSTYHAAGDRQDLLPQARYALERMVMFVQESDQIVTPDTATGVEVLTVSERASDQYNNASHAYTAAGDGLPDADNDANGLINDPSLHPLDPPDFITFDWDKTDPNNGRLMEQMPDYATLSTSDFKAKKIICEHVTYFSCRRLLSPSGTISGRVEITLTLQQGNTTVTLKTTAKSRWVD